MRQEPRDRGSQLRYLRRAVKQGGWVAWAFVGTLLVIALVSVTVLTVTVRERFRRDIMRMAFNGNLELLDDVKRRVDASRDTLDQRVASVATPPPGDHPYIVVSIREKRLWYRQGDRTIFTTRVATGTGKELIQNGPNGGVHWKFETPRGRLVVESKETDPVWVPPDWHYVEMARKKRLGVIKLARGQRIPIGGGAVITVNGTDVVTLYPDGHEVPFEVHEGKEIVANKDIVIPPYGTEQRKYLGTLGVH